MVNKVVAYNYILTTTTCIIQISYNMVIEPTRFVSKIVWHLNN